MYIRKGLIQGECQKLFKYKINNIDGLDLILEMLLQRVTLQVLQKYQFRDRCNVAQIRTLSLS
jgi:folate-binding Fe-S cluster repair protein YgfZ